MSEVDFTGINDPPDEAISDAEISSQDKLEKIHAFVISEFGGDDPSVIFAYGGGIKENTATGKYRSLAYSDLGEHQMVTGSRTRVIAAAEIARALPETDIVTTSFNRFDNTVPTMASVVKRELERRGVSSSRITLEEASFSTITQLREMVMLASSHPWKNIAIVTNDYHVPRMQAMFDRLGTLVVDGDFQTALQSFNANSTQVKFIAAEDILRIMGSRLADYLDLVKLTPEYQKTIEAEARGLEDLKNGNYQITLTPEKRPKIDNT